MSTFDSPTTDASPAPPQDWRALSDRLSTALEPTAAPVAISFLPRAQAAPVARLEAVTPARRLTQVVDALEATVSLNRAMASYAAGQLTPSASPDAVYRRDCVVRDPSLARPPRRMLGTAVFPSWHAYSYSW